MGTMDRTVSPASVLEIWGDVVRDTDQFGLKLTRLSDREEVELGEQVFAQEHGPYLKTDLELSSYVSAVGAAVAAHTRRRKIAYRFHIAQWPEPNAFALPGGHVIITTGMLAHLHSEAELAMVLGHEIAHVDLRHCVEHYQYSARLGTVGAKPAGIIVDLARIPLTISYSKYQELEADAQGLAMAAEAGYEPRAAAGFMVRFAAIFTAGKPRPQQTRATPIEEAAEMSVQTLAGYFRSHPLFPQRIQRLQNLAAKLARRMAGRAAYVGTENYGWRIPRIEREFPAERVRL